MRQAQGAGNIAMPLTHVSPNQISGLIEALAAQPYDGKADLPDIAYEQELEVDELFPVAEAMQLLRLADVEGGDIKLTHMGKRFADADLNERKEIFSRALMSQVPLAAHIRRCWTNAPAIPRPRPASWTSWKIIWPRMRRKKR
jgi:NitT/TauT family transport system ATP-binding protein